MIPLPVIRKDTAYSANKYMCPDMILFAEHYDGTVYRSCWQDSSRKKCVTIEVKNVNDNSSPAVITVY